MTDREPFTIGRLQDVLSKAAVRGWRCRDPHLYLSTRDYLDICDELRDVIVYPRKMTTDDPLPEQLTVQTAIGPVAVMRHRWLRTFDGWLNEGPLETPASTKEEEPAPRGNGGGFEFL